MKLGWVSTSNGMNMGNRLSSRALLACAALALSGCTAFGPVSIASKTTSQSSLTPIAGGDQAQLPANGSLDGTAGSSAPPAANNGGGGGGSVANPPPASGGGGGGAPAPTPAPTPVPTPPPVVDNGILYQQAANSVTASDIYVEGVASVCRMGAAPISQWFRNKYAGDGKNVPLHWNAVEFTGFDPGDPASHSLGLTDSQYGGTVIQFNGPTAGWQIETTTARSDDNPEFIAGIIAAATICDGNGGERKVHPFAKAGQMLTYSVDLQVPHSNAVHGSVNTAAAMFYFIDPTVPPAGLGFWYSYTLYSSIDQQETVIYDVGTLSGIVGAFPGHNGPYSTDAGGNQMHRSTWTGFKKFTAAMTAQNLRNAIAGINAAAGGNGNLTKYAALSDDPSVYIIGGGILDTEVARAGGHDGSMGLSFQNMSIRLVPEGTRF